MVPEIIPSRYDFVKVRKLKRVGGPIFQVVGLGNARTMVGNPSYEEEGSLLTPWLNPGWAWKIQPGSRDLWVARSSKPWPRGQG